MPEISTTIIVKNQWFEQSLDYALKSWTSTFNRMGKPNPYARIEKIVLGLIAEKAVESYLLNSKIPYNTNGKTRWYETDRYDLGIGNFAIDVKANFINLSSNYFIKYHSGNYKKNKSAWLNKCHALVPFDQFTPKKTLKNKLKKEKIYIFPFIEGHFNENHKTDCLIHTFWDYRWLKRAEHKDLPHLGHLNIFYNGNQNGKIKIYGTTNKKQIIVEELDITNSSNKTKNNFFQVFAIRWFGNIPDGQLIIKSSELKLTENISPENKFELARNQNKKYIPTFNNWQNLAFYNGKVNLSGWINEKKMIAIGDKIPRFAKYIQQYQETKIDNWACWVLDLKNMNTIKSVL